MKVENIENITTAREEEKTKSTGTYKIRHNKPKQRKKLPKLVVSYNIRLGNTVGLFDQSQSSLIN